MADPAAAARSSGLRGRRHLRHRGASAHRRHGPADRQVELKPARSCRVTGMGRTTTDPCIIVIGRADIEIDDDLIAKVMEQNGLKTKTMRSTSRSASRQPPSARVLALEGIGFEYSMRAATCSAAASRIVSLPHCRALDAGVGRRKKGWGSSSSRPRDEPSSTGITAKNGQVSSEARARRVNSIGTRSPA